MRIRHVIAGVGATSPTALQAAHAGALASVRRAVAQVPSDVSVEVIIVGFPDECPAEGPWRFVPTEREGLGKNGFKTQRRLPYLADMITPLHVRDAFDLGILTNADIELAEDFYGRLGEFNSQDVGPISVTRLMRLDEPEPDSHEHPGHDCFVASARDWQRAVAGDVVLGVPGVMKALLWSLAAVDRPVRVLHGTGWTFHYGDEREWASPSMADYAQHNEGALRVLAADLLSQRGTAAVAATPSMRPWLGQPANPNTLVFSLNPGRSASESLARLLAGSSQVTAGHEREPMMIGPWLRMVGFQGGEATLDARRFKARAIEVELNLYRPGLYVDTSHLFLYTFADVVLENFPDRDVVAIRLHRDPLAVAKSYLELGFFSRHSTLGADWHFWPTWPTSYLPMKLEHVTSEWDLVFGSLIDFYRRQAALIERYRGQLRIVPMRARDLNDPAWQDGLAGALGIDPKELNRPSAGTGRWNHKTHERIRSVQGTRVAEEFEAFCRRFAIDQQELDGLGWNGPFG